jgi:hypothetical protein
MESKANGTGAGHLQVSRAALVCDAMAVPVHAFCVTILNDANRILPGSFRQVILSGPVQNAIKLQNAMPFRHYRYDFVLARETASASRKVLNEAMRASGAR